MEINLFTNILRCPCGARPSSLKKAFNHMVCCREQVTRVCYCQQEVTTNNVVAHLDECEYLGTFGCALCTATFKDLTQANNHAWSVHGGGRFKMSLQPTVVFLRRFLEAQGLTRFAHMTVDQLREKSSNNKLRRLILATLIIESDFHRPNSKFLQLCPRDVAPCFEKPGRLYRFEVSVCERRIKVVINRDEELGQSVFKRLYNYRVLDAQAWFNVQHNHDHFLGDQRLNELVDQVNMFLSSWNHDVPVAAKVVSVVTKAVIMIRSEFDYVICGAVILDALCSFGLTASLAASLGPLLIDKIRSLFGYANNELEAQVGGESVVSILGLLLGTLALKKIPSGSQMGELIAGASKMGTLARGLTFAWDALERIVKYVVGKIHEWKTGMPSSIEDIDRLISGTQVWYQRVQELARLEFTDDVAKDRELCSRVEVLYNEGLRLKARVQEYKLEAKLVSAFNEHFRFISSCYEKAQGSGAFREGPRPEPVLLYIYGTTGVGKSALVWPLCQDILLSEGGYDADFLKYVYVRRVEQKFWNGYRSHPIVVYDDFGQVADSPANPNDEFIEMIRTGNIAPYPLNMAHLEDKNKTNFTSKVVLCTSNTDPSRFRPGSLTHPDAFRRRFDVCAEVTVHPHFRVYDANGNPRIDKAAVLRLTGQKFSTQVYRIRLTDPLDGTALSQWMNYDEFQAIVLRKMQNRFADDRAFQDFLLGRNPVEAQIGEVEARLARLPNSQVEMRDPEEILHSLTLDEVREMLVSMHVWDWDIFSEDISTALRQADTLDDEDMRWFRNFITEFEGDVYIDGVENYIQVLIENEWHAHQADELFPVAWENRLPMLDKFFYVDTPQVSSKVYKYLYSLSEGTSSLWTSFKEKAQEAWNSNPWLKDFAVFAAEVALVFAVVRASVALFGYAKNRFFSNRPAPLDHEHKGLKIGERVEHAHLCTDCGQYFLHTHRIKTKTESEKFPQKCVSCLMEPELESSGDPKTVASKNVKIEGEPQKDHISLLDVVSELESSGDPRTAVKQVAKTELESSGDPRTAGREKTKVEVGAELAVDPNSMGVAKKLINNFYRIELERNGKYSSRMNILMIVGRVGLTAGHLRPYLEEATRVRIYNPAKKQGHVFETSELRYVQVADAKGEYKDQMLIQFPKTLHDHVKLLSSLSTSQTLSSFIETKGCLVTLNDNGVIMKYGSVKGIDYNARQYQDDKGNAFKIRDRYEYTDLETTRGDCGSVLMAVSPSISEKILGIHVAGSVGLGVSTPINRVQIMKALKELDLDAQVELDFDSVVHEHCTNEDVKLPEGDFLPVGKIQKPIMGPSKTKLRPSKIYGVVKSPITKPAALRPVLVNGELVDPMMLGLKKAGKIPPTLNKDYLESAVNSFKNLALANAKPKHRRLISYEEAVAGVEGEEFIRPVRRQTSPGYPWVLDNPGTGKHHWLGTDEDYKLDEKVEQLMDERILAAFNNIRQPTVWIDTLKDERRPIEKVDQGKTRVFAAGNFEYLLTFKVFFSGFFAHLSENRIDNEVSVGTNPYGPDWTKTAKKVLSKGNKVIAGDFSNFDGTLVIDILHEILEIVQEFYQDEYYDVRRILWREIVNSVHLHQDVLYLWTHSQPSGCPITASLNSMYNSISMRYVWQLVVPKELRPMAYYERYVSMVSYGDDNIVNIADEVVEYFNQNTIAEGYEQIGMTYTDEHKSGVMAPFRSLAEISYLKRSFRWSEEDMEYLAPLNLDTILEMMNWVRGDLDQELSTLENVETACFELHLHGREVFDYWMPRVRAACSSFSIFPAFRTYREYREMELDKYGKLETLHAQIGTEERGRIRTSLGYDPRESQWKRVLVMFLMFQFFAPWYVFCQLLELTLLMNWKGYRIRVLGVCTLLLLVPYFLPKAPIYPHDEFGNFFYQIQGKGQPFIAVDALQQSPVLGGLSPEEFYELLVSVRLLKQRILTRRVNNQVDKLIPGECLILSTMNADKQTDFVEQQQITRFADDVVPEYYEKPRMEDPLVTSSGRESMQHSIASILSRPHLVATGTLPLPATPPVKVDFPQALFSSANVTDKLNYFNYFRADVKVRFQFNATPFQQGRYWMFFSPYDALSNRPNNGTLYSQTGYPGVEIDIANGAPVELTIPYCAPMTHYGLVTKESTMGTLEVVSIVPLASATTGSTSCGYQIYAWFENIELSLPTNLPLTAQIGEEEEQSKSGIISAPAAAVAKIADAATPLLPKLFQPLSWMARAVSGAAANVGFNKPTSVAATTPLVNLPGKGYTNADGLDLGVRLGMAPDGKLASTDSYFSTARDEMDINYVTSKSCIAIPTVDWGVGRSAGDLLLYWQNSPGCFYSGSERYIDPTTLNFVTSMFRFWRGGLKYRLTVTKTAFHSGRLRVSFIPHSNLLTPTGNTEYCHNWILDLSKSSELEFEIPYVSNRPWLDARLVKFSETSYWTRTTAPGRTGTIIVEVLSPLIAASTTVAQSVTLTLWHSAGEDFELAVPEFSYYAVEARPPPTPPNGFLEAQVFNETDDAIAHREQEVNSSVPMFEAPSAKMEPLASCIGERVTNLRTLTRRFGAYVRGTPFPYRRPEGVCAVGPYDPASSADYPYGYNNFRIDPAFFGIRTGGVVPLKKNFPTVIDADGTKQLAQFDVAYTLDNNTPLHYISYIYRFWRGSKRYKVFLSPPNVPKNACGAWAVPSAPLAAQPYEEPTQTLRTVGTDAQRPMLPVIVKRERNLTENGTIFSTDLTSHHSVQAGGMFEHTLYPDLTGCVEFELPYYSTTPISLVCEGTLQDTNGLLVQRAIANVTYGGDPESLDSPIFTFIDEKQSPFANRVTRGSIGEFRLFTAAGDDFSFGYLVGAPTIRELEAIV